MADEQQPSEPQQPGTDAEEVPILIIVSGPQGNTVRCFDRSLSPHGVLMMLLEAVEMVRQRNTLENLRALQREVPKEQSRIVTPGASVRPVQIVPR